MKSWALALYGFGMMSCGYAAGLRMNGEDWTHIPWWGDLLFGVAIIIAANVLDWRDRR